MPHMDETGLAYYSGKLKPWIASQPVKTLPSSLYPWTQTDKAGAVTCWPVGGTQLLPTVDFMFTETGPASGDKGPENPSTISGVSEVNLWLAGKNINRTTPYYAFVDGERTINGVKFKANPDGTVVVNGVATGQATCALYNSSNTSAYGEPIGVGEYIVSGCPEGGSFSGYSLQCIVPSGYGTSAYEYGSGKAITIDKPGARFGLAIRIPSGYTAQNLVFKPQIELASAATEYEQPVEKQEYTILLNGTFYGGTVDLATGVMTVTHVEAVFDGTESWSKYSSSTEDVSNFYTTANLLPRKGGSYAVCSHFTMGSEAVDENTFYMWGENVRLYVRISSETAGTVEELKAWLASQYANGTPLTVVYMLSSPNTIQLTPTQILALPQTDKYTPRINTIYTDVQSVQVGYVKSPIHSEYELVQAIVAQGGNV